MMSSPSNAPSVPVTQDPGVAGELSTGARLFNAVLVVCSLTLGLVLLVLPWSANWDRNFLALHWTAMQRWVLSPFARGGVSGLGLVQLWLGSGQIEIFRR